MAPLLGELGYEPIKLASLADIDSLASTGLRGAIISLAISSSTGATAAETVDALSRRFPGLPLVFAGMIGIDMAAQNIGRLYAQGSAPRVIGVDGPAGTLAAAGSKTACLYINKEQIADAKRHTAIKTMLKAHFR
ncbi:MAG: hypothetical protein KGJ32_04820 [Xanthomonadaceae bacterium]|nr:hypothetical protein [Xanthomonadaceae bacterium]